MSDATPPLTRFTILGDTDAASCESEVCELPAQPDPPSPQPENTSTS